MNLMAECNKIDKFYRNNGWLFKSAPKDVFIGYSQEKYFGYKTKAKPFKLNVAGR